jgi:hypothetical protein
MFSKRKKKIYIFSFSFLIKRLSKYAKFMIQHKIYKKLSNTVQNFIYFLIFLIIKSDMHNKYLFPNKINKKNNEFTQYICNNI